MPSSHLGRVARALAADHRGRWLCLSWLCALAGCSSVDEGLLARPAPMDAEVGTGEAGARRDAGRATQPGAAGASGMDGAIDAAQEAGVDAGLARPPDRDAGAGCVPNPNVSDQVCTKICPERCNDRDDDCDRKVDEGEALTACALDHAAARCVRGRCAVVACDADFRDCDGDAANGCESSLDDVESCGGCGKVCDLTHAVATCVGRRCVVAQCDAGWGDCDADPLDCERPLTTAADCAACGVRCDDPPNALAACVSGVCALGLCLGHYGDCNLDPRDGCELELTTVDDCGGCGRPCSDSLPNASAGTCVDATCELTCDPGWGDCNGDPSNGCETPLGSVQNCSGCGSACALDHAITTCNAGSCEFVRCADGWADCDATLANGCEQSLNDDAHCGGCANDCTGTGLPVCSGGQCGAVVCPAGQADCNQDGFPCEVDVGGDPANCGTCGFACALSGAGDPHAAGGLDCQSGNCVPLCDAGFADCDGDYRNGCETSLLTLADCGGCGVGCAIAYATATCATGACRVAQCDPDRADCDGDQKSCETRLDTTSNCGACGTRCDLFNAVEICGGSAGNRSCQIDVCDASYFKDCDTLAATGCEVDTRSNTQNCGACGNDCDAQANVATTHCADSACVIDACDAGYGNCTGAAGCETPVNTPQNCGACSYDCSVALPNTATTQCVSFMCQLGACATGWADCTAAPGCDTDIFDAASCGGCANLGQNQPCEALDQVAASSCAAGTCTIDACNLGFEDCDRQSANGCELEPAVDGPCCDPFSDVDGDGLSECDELRDASPWTDPLIFNGARVRQANQCDATGACTVNDTLVEVNACMAVPIQETRNQHAGWDWNDPADSICDPGYGFAPNWTNCDPTWQADWTGYVYLDTSGRHCFGVSGSATGGCSAIFFNEQTAAVQNGAQQCFDVPAGVYPIRWHHTMIGGSGASMHVNYCFGGGANCTPAVALPSSMLRVISPCPSCDDGDPCTLGTCTLAGMCSYSGAPGGTTCADESNPCTTDVCNGTACTHPPGNDGTACADDGNGCTTDVCGGGACTHPAGNDGTACADDGNGCTTDVCGGGACTHPAGNDGAACAGDGNICTTDVCGGGACTHPAVMNGTTCNDGQFCTVNDACQGGTCQGGGARNCGDGLSCTADNCNEAIDQCQNPISGGYCVITGGCVAQGSSDPANECRECNPATSTTSYVSKPNGTACTSDGMSCTSDLCTSGTCTHTPLDTDGDGTNDCVDGCPTDPNKIAPGLCGCGFVETPGDTDGDGVADCMDACPYDGTRTVAPCLAGYRKKLTIAAGKVGATLTDFPVLVHLTADADLGARASSGGTDLVFKDAAGNLLAFEREYWSKAANEFRAWVKIPSIASGTATNFYLHYGDGTTVDRSNQTGTWSNGFEAVWHLEELPASATAIKDSSGKNHTSTGVAGLSGAKLVAGLIGSGMNFDGSGDYINFGSIAATNSGTVLTVTAWVKHTALSPWDPIVQQGNGTTQGWWLGVHNPADDSAVGVMNGSAQDFAWTTGLAPATGAFHQWAFTYNDAAATRLKAYYDGAQQPVTLDASCCPGGWNASNGALWIGADPSDPASRCTNGVIDEVHVSTVERSAAWIKAEYDNQMCPTFFTLGPQETL